MTGATDALDLTFLHAQTFGDTTFEREVLGLFLAQGDRLIVRLADLPVAEQTATAHLLKGSCQGLGAGPLAELLDRYGRADASERRRLDPAVRHAFRALVAEIEARLDTL